MLKFDDKTGFYVSEVEELREEIARQWKQAFKEDGKPELNTEPETPVGQIIDSQVASIAQKDAEIAYIANQFNPLTASGIWQDALAKIYFLDRHFAQNSVVELTCKGLQGTLIAKGSQVKSTIDGTFWTIDKDVYIDGDGKAVVNATCNTSGAIEAGKNTLTKIVTVTVGWDSVTNLNNATVGNLDETQASFEDRRYKSVGLKSRGSLQSVYARVADVKNVLSTYVAQNRTNEIIVIDGKSIKPHSIYVAVLGGSDEDIAKAIYNSVSAGCDYTGNTTVAVTDPNCGSVERVIFERPEPLDIHVKIQVQDEELPNNYIELIQNAVFNNFYGNDGSVVDGQKYLRVNMYDDLYASRFIISVLNTGIKRVLNSSISFDDTEYLQMLHIPIDKNPVLTLENIHVEAVNTKEPTEPTEPEEPTEPTEPEEPTEPTEPEEPTEPTEETE